MPSLAYEFDGPPRLVPTIGMDAKPEKLPIHQRGRILIGAVVLSWCIIGLGVWSYFA